ncbi:MAG: ABC transporter substrate-binding protein, partial [Acidobacteria bacterium]|nr:ABC transporter substrate-binding protein [Acidobacteriota bacterium]
MTPTRRALAISALALLLPIVDGCSAPEPAKPKVQQILKMRMRENPPDTDPAQSADSLSDRINLAVHDGLVDFDPESLAIVPAVAESWEISKDGLIYTFRLHPGVRFHNGKVLTSADVLYSFTRVLDPKVNSKRREILAGVKGAEAFGRRSATQVEGLSAPDPKTFVITLEKPMPYFLQLLATPAAAIVPRPGRPGANRSYSGPAALRRGGKLGWKARPWVGYSLPPTEHH